MCLNAMSRHRHGTARNPRIEIHALLSGGVKIQTDADFQRMQYQRGGSETTFWLTPNTATCDCASSRAPFFRQMLDPVQFKAEVLFESPNHVCFLMCIPKSQESGRAMLRPYAYDVDRNSDNPDHDGSSQ